MQRIINFVVRYKEYITFVALVILSFSLITMGDVSKIGGFRTIVVGSIGWVQNIFSWIPNPTAMQSENIALRNLNLELSTEVVRMRHALLENKNLKELLELKKNTEFETIAAQVVGKSTIQMRSYLTINKGINAGIEKGMTVRNDAGLIGVVIGLTKNYSLIELITNRDLKIAGRVQRNGIDGIVTWEGGLNFAFKNIPKSFDLKSGDTILTSNNSNKYPAFIPIGVVSEVSDSPNELFQKIVINPFVNFSYIEQVFVLKYIPDPERNELMKEIDELLKARAAAPKQLKSKTNKQQ